MDWRYGSSNRVPALQAQSPEFKPQTHQKKKKKGPAVGRIYIPPNYWRERVHLDRGVQHFFEGLDWVSLCLIKTNWLFIREGIGHTVGTDSSPHPQPAPAPQRLCTEKYILLSSLPPRARRGRCYSAPALSRMPEPAWL
jgi:hypothetical protein